MMLPFYYPNLPLPPVWFRVKLVEFYPDGSIKRIVFG